MNKVFILSLVYGFFCLASDAAYAVTIDRSKVIVEVAPSQQSYETLTLRNDGKVDVSLRIYTEDFQYLEPYDGKKEYFPPFSLPHSIGNWIDIQPKELTIPQGGSADITLSIKAPADFQSASCGIIFAEMSMGKGFDESGKSIQVLNRIGSLVFLNPAGSNDKAEVKDVKAGDGRIGFKIKNSGKTYIMPEVNYYIMDNDGVVTRRDAFEPRYLLPDVEADYTINFNDALPAGDYLLFLNTEFGKDVVMAREVDFSVDAPGTITITDLRD